MPIVQYLFNSVTNCTQAPACLTAAEMNDRRSGAHPGLHYCKGLYARYTNDVNLAIKEFNLARRDAGECVYVT